MSFARLDEFVDDQRRLGSFLSTTERQRAKRFTFVEDREHYIRRRGLLRLLLSCYTGVTAAEIRFGCEGNGKPVLDPSPSGAAVHFNLSHTDGLAAYAMTRIGSVGIDVERVKEFPDWQGLVLEHFSERERSEVLDFPPDQRLHAFYRVWVCKEAVLKAMGEGIHAGLLRVEVSLGAEDGTKIRRIDGSEHLAAGWTIAEIPICRDVVSAVALQSPCIRISCGWVTSGQKSLRPQCLEPASP